MTSFWRDSCEFVVETIFQMGFEYLEREGESFVAMGRQNCFCCE